MKGKFLAVAIATALSVMPMAASAEITPAQQQNINNIISANGDMSVEELLVSLMAEVQDADMIAAVIQSIADAKGVSVASVTATAAAASTEGSIAADTATIVEAVVYENPGEADNIVAAVVEEVPSAENAVTEAADTATELAQTLQEATENPTAAGIETITETTPTAATTTTTQAPNTAGDDDNDDNGISQA